jgi:hypothetical protein
LLTQTCHKSRAEAEDPLAAPTASPATGTIPALAARPCDDGPDRQHGRLCRVEPLRRPRLGRLHPLPPRPLVDGGTGLGYGDVLGASSKIFGYEVDGIDYEIRKGLPFPAPDTGLEGELTIVALSPATTLAHHTGRHDADHFIGTSMPRKSPADVYGEVTPETLGLASRGNGCMAEYRRGKGAVFNAGSCEWVAGLIARERGGAVTRTLGVTAQRNCVSTASRLSPSSGQR